MSKDSKNEWSHHTFNPCWGCVNVTPAWDHCDAETFSKRVGFDVRGAAPERRFFGQACRANPIKWDAAAAAAGRRDRVFCASMADVFESRADFVDTRARLFELIDCEPVLGAVDLAPFRQTGATAIDWVVAGGESGHHSRPMHPTCALRLQRQCTELEIAFQTVGRLGS